MKKTYKTRYTGYGIYVNIGGKLQHIRFEKRLVPSIKVGSTFTAEDVELQRALEKHRDYGMEFWTDDKESVAEIKEDAQIEQKKVKRYKTKE